MRFLKLALVVLSAFVAESANAYFVNPGGVNPTTTGLSLSLTSNTTPATLSSRFGSAIVFTATVTGQTACPCGHVFIVIDGADAADLGAANSPGAAMTVSLSNVGIGSHTVYSEFRPSGLNEASHSANIAFTVTASGVVLSSSSAAPKDSQNARALQIGLSTSAASTSAQVTAGAIDGGINAGFSNSAPAASFGPNGGFINLLAEPKLDTPRKGNEAFSALAQEKTLSERQWSAWADFRGSGWTATDTSGNGNDAKGSQLNVTAGVGRKINGDTLVGMVFGYEHFKFDVPALAGSLSGDGETLGAYFTQRFGTNLRFDAALAWSNLNYNASAGAASGSFIGRRILATGGLTGNHELAGLVIEPSAKLFLLWESQQAWVDSLGTLQDGRNFSAGRVALGSKVAHQFILPDSTIITPYAGFYADRRFQSDSAVPTASPVANIAPGWSGRVTGGIAARNSAGNTLSLDAEYGGLGANYKIWAGSVRAVVPFGAEVDYSQTAAAPAVAPVSVPWTYTGSVEAHFTTLSGNNAASQSVLNGSLARGTQYYLPIQVGTSGSFAPDFKLDLGVRGGAVSSNQWAVSSAGANLNGGIGTAVDTVLTTNVEYSGLSWAIPFWSTNINLPTGHPVLLGYARYASLDPDLVDVGAFGTGLNVGNVVGLRTQLDPNNLLTISVGYTYSGGYWQASTDGSGSPITQSTKPGDDIAFNATYSSQMGKLYLSLLGNLFLDGQSKTNGVGTIQPGMRFGFAPSAIYTWDDKFTTSIDASWTRSMHNFTPDSSGIFVAEGFNSNNDIISANINQSMKVDEHWTYGLGGNVLRRFANAWDVSSQSFVPAKLKYGVLGSVAYAIDAHYSIKLSAQRFWADIDQTAVLPSFQTSGWQTIVSANASF